MSAPRLTRNPWPAGIVMFFVVAILSLSAFVVFAARQNIDLVCEDYYEEELRFQTQLDRINRTAPIRKDVTIHYAIEEQAVTVVLPAAHRKLQPTGRIQLYRPSDAQLDREWPLQLDENGTQHLDVKDLQAGLWRAQLFWTVDGQEYFFSQPIILAGGSAD